MGQKNSLLLLVSLLLLFATVAPFTVIPVKASQDSSGFPSITIESYTVGVDTTYYSTGSIPVGALIEFRVWVDLYNIDPVKIAYADGTSDSANFDGSFSHDFYHSYDKAGVYAPEAYMPTDSGTFTGFPAQPLTIGGSGTSGYDGVPTVTGVGPLDALVNGVDIVLTSIGGVFGLSGSYATTAGVVVTLIAIAALGIIMGRIRTNGTRITRKQTGYLSEQSTPQLLRSAEPNKQETKGSDLECKNLKAIWEDDKKKADFAKGLESAARARFARDLQKLPEDIWKKCLEYIKDQAKDQIQELTEDTITAFFVAVPEVEVLTQVFVEVSKYMTKDTEAEPGLFEKLLNDQNSVVNTHAEATRLADLADFRFNEYKTRCL